jgi:hypothetical protein
MCVIRIGGRGNVSIELLRNVFFVLFCFVLFCFVCDLFLAFFSGGVGE